MNITQELDRHLIQAVQAYEDWYLKGGEEKARKKCLELLREEAIKRGWDKPLTPEEAFEHHTRLRKDFPEPEEELQRKLNITPSGALKSLSLKLNLNNVLKKFGIDKKIN